MKNNPESITTPSSSIGGFHNAFGPLTLAIAIYVSFLFSGTSYGEFLILGITVYIIGLFILNRDEHPYSRLHILIYLFFIYILLNPLWSIDFSLSLLHILILCLVPLIFLLFSNKQIQGSWSNYLLFLAIPAFISSIFGIAEFIQTDQSNFGIISHRIDSFLYDPNSYSAIQYIFSILLFSLIYCHTPENPLTRGIIWFIQFLVITALFLTLSRSGILLWLAFITVIFIYALTRKTKNLGKYILLPIIVALLSFSSLKLMVNQIDQPLARDDLPGGLTSTTLNGRFPIWEPTLKLIEERPLLGWGLKTFVSLYPSVRKEFYSLGSVVHNDYIQFMLEGGIVLLLFLLMFLGYHLYLFIKLLLQNRKKLDDMAGLELAMMLFANIALLLHSITNFSFYILQLCILSGMIFARSYYLAVNIGLVKQPTLIYFTKTRRGILVLLLTAIMITILYRVLSGFLFIAPERHDITKSISSNMSVLNTFHAISPHDRPSSTRMATVLISQLNAVSDIKTKKKIIDDSILILEAISLEYPYHAPNYTNLGNLLHLAYTQLPDYKESYRHYADLWMKSIEVDPVYIPPYRKLYDDLSSKQQYKQALSIMERLIPWIKSGKISKNNLMGMHAVLIDLGEKAADDLLPLYEQLSLSSEQGDNKTYYETVNEINQRLKRRKSTPEVIQPISLPSPTHLPSPFPSGEG